MPFSFDPTIKLSDVLTSLSFLLAVLALIYSQRKDRDTATHVRLDAARTTISASLSSLERWGEIIGGIFDDVQPIIIATTEIWATSGDVAASRDYMWKQLTDKIAALQTSIRDEKINLAYLNLYCLNPTMPAEYRQTIARLDVLARTINSKMLGGMEQVILMGHATESVRQSADMGNRLRPVIADCKVEFQKLYNTEKENISSGLLQRLSMSDDDLLADLNRDR